MVLALGAPCATVFTAPLIVGKITRMRGNLTHDNVILTSPRADQDNAVIKGAHQLYEWDIRALRPGTGGARVTEIRRAGEKATASLIEAAGEGSARPPR